MGQADPKRIIFYLLLFVGVLYFAANLPFGAQTFPEFVARSLVSLPGLVMVALVFLGLITWLKEDVWLVIPFALINPIALGFLPFKFQWIELVTLVLVAYLFVIHLAMHHRTLDFGPKRFWMPLAIIALIILYHQKAIGIGLSALGSESGGTRRHASMLIGIGFFLVMMSLKPRRWETFRRLPGFWLGWTLFKTVPTIFSYYFPELAIGLGLFHFFADLTYVEDLFGGAAEFGRVGSWGQLALALQLWLVSRFPINTWFRLPRLEEGLRLLAPAGSLFALLACALSGFRTYLFEFGIITIVAALLALRWRMLVFVIPAALTLAFLVVGQGRLFDLPFQMQRTLSFIPGGNWGATERAHAESSNYFREAVAQTYMDVYARSHPWLGDGYKVYTAEAVSGPMADLSPGGFIRRKDFHIGWISLYDCVGLVGTAAMLFLLGQIIWVLWKDSRRIGWGRLEPVQIWVACFFGYHFASYWVIFGAMSLFLPVIGFSAAMTWIVFREMPQQVPTKAPMPAFAPKNSLPVRLAARMA
jgi:hypothetical protein